MECDVAILGAGPAALATALTLRRHNPGLAIVMLDGPQRARGKIGETLPPGAQAVLRSLGVWEAFLASAPLPAYGTCAAWGSNQLESHEFIFHPENRGWHLDREIFDQSLASETDRLGVAIRRDAHPLHWRRAEGRWLGEAARVTDTSLQRPQSISARFVIDATGRRAAFATSQGARRILDDRLVAISVSFWLSADAPMRDTYALVEACAEGWWYSSLLPDGGLIVAFMTDADLARTQRMKQPEVWLAAAQRSPHTYKRIQTAMPEGAPQLRVADSVILNRLTGEDWLATGDAAWTLDPLASQGVLKALQQGKLAAYAVSDHLSGDPEALPKYEAVLQHQHRDYLVQKRSHYSLESRWPDAPFWRRRQGPIELDPLRSIPRSEPLEECFV